MDEFFAYREGMVANGRLSPVTVNGDRRWLAQFVALVPEMPYTRQQVEAFNQALMDRGLTGTSRTHPFSSLRAFQKWVTLEKRDVYVPPISDLVPARDTQQPDVLSDEQVEAILRQARQGPPWHYCALELIRRTGIRPWMLRELTWEHLAKERGRGFTTNRKPRKKAYYVGLTPDLYALICQSSPSAAAKKGYIFPAENGGLMTKDTLTHMVSRCFERAGVQADKKGPYMLRHTYAERVKRSMGVEVAAQLMGNSIAMVETVYGKTPRAVIEEMADQSHALWKPMPVGRQMALDGMLEETAPSPNGQGQEAPALSPAKEH